MADSSSAFGADKPGSAAGSVDQILPVDKPAVVEILAEAGILVVAGILGSADILGFVEGMVTVRMVARTMDLQIIQE